VRRVRRDVFMLSLPEDAVGEQGALGADGATAGAHHGLFVWDTSMGGMPTCDGQGLGCEANNVGGLAA
jgi:hypothetical protein